MTEATILTHIAALVAGMAVTYGYLRHVGGWQSALEGEIALLKHHLGLGPLALSSPHPVQVPNPSAPVAPVSSPVATGGVPSVTHPV